MWEITGRDHTKPSHIVLPPDLSYVSFHGSDDHSCCTIRYPFTHCRGFLDAAHEGSFSRIWARAHNSGARSYGAGIVVAESSALCRSGLICDERALQ